jgi:hypothetical protein
MKWFLLFYDLVPGYIERRAPFRPEHLKLAQAAQARGELVLAGAFGDPPEGALLVFKGEDASAAEAFARSDPYVANGVVTAWRVKPWTVVIGG